MISIAAGQCSVSRNLVVADIARLPGPHKMMSSHFSCLHRIDKSLLGKWKEIVQYVQKKLKIKKEGKERKRNEKK